MNYCNSTLDSVRKQQVRFSRYALALAFGWLLFAFTFLIFGGVIVYNLIHSR